MKSIKANVILTTSNEQMRILWNRYWGVFEWMRYFHLKTKTNIITSKGTLFDFENNVSKNTKSRQLIEFKPNETDYDKYALNILDHSGTSIWISEGKYNGNPNYYNWDGGELGFLYIKKDWEYKDKFIDLLNKSCSIWTQYNNGCFDWVYDLSDEEVKLEYQERTNEQECNCNNCIICLFYPSIDEMRDKINNWEIEFYDYKYDKFGLEFINQELFGGR